MAQGSELGCYDALIVVDGHDAASGAMERALLYAARGHWRVGVLVTPDGETAVRGLLQQEQVNASRVVVTDSLRDALYDELARYPVDIVLAGLDQLGATAFGSADAAPDVLRTVGGRTTSLLLLTVAHPLRVGGRPAAVIDPRLEAL